MIYLNAIGMCLTEQSDLLSKDYLKAYWIASKHGGSGGFSDHDLMDRNAFFDKSGARSIIEDIKRAAVDAARLEGLSLWQFAAYLDSKDASSDLDSLAGKVLNLQDSGSKFTFDSGLNIYGESLAFFRIALKAYLNRLDNNSKNYLRELWGKYFD